jgi:hypothetical protein
MRRPAAGEAAFRCQEELLQFRWQMPSEPPLLPTMPRTNGKREGKSAAKLAESRQTSPATNDIHQATPPGPAGRVAANSKPQPARKSRNSDNVAQKEKAGKATKQKRPSK